MSDPKAEKKRGPIIVGIHLFTYVGIMLINTFIFTYKTEMKIRSLFNNPEYEEEYERNDSLLRYELIDENKCSDHWRFSRIWVRQSDIEPDPENHYLFEQISKDLKGTYDEFNIDVRQWVSIHNPDIDLRESYEQTVEDRRLIHTSKDNDGQSLLIIEEDNLFAACSAGVSYREESYTNCSIVTISGSIMENVKIYVYESDISDKMLENMINEVILLIQ